MLQEEVGEPFEEPADEQVEEAVDELVEAEALEGRFSCWKEAIAV